MDTRRTVSTLVVATLFYGSPAYAQDPASSDPLEGSPSGLQYELPVDGARKDAAPDRGARKQRQNGNGGTDSPIRSDNGFGASSEVPGVQATAAGEESSTNRKDEGGKKGTSRKGEEGKPGAGDETNEDDGTPAAVPSVPTAAAEAPDGVQAGLLLGLSALVGGGVGIAARRSRRRS